MPTNYSNRNSVAPDFSSPGLNDEARKAINAAFDALSHWRNDIAATTERHSAATYDKMATAAKAMGWPANIIDTTFQQMQQASKLQLQFIDEVMDAWEGQMKNPGAGFSNFSQLSGAFGGMSNANRASPFGVDMSNFLFNPMQFWLQAADMWQKSWQQSMGPWKNMYK